MSPIFTVSSGEIAVGDPLGAFQRFQLPSRNPGNYRLAPKALVRTEDASEEGTPLEGELIFVWDAVFTDALANAVQKHRDNCSGDAAMMERRSRQLSKLTGTRIGCYRARYACDAIPPGRYQLKPANVVRSSAWRAGFREAAGTLSLRGVVWRFSLGVLAAGFLCLLGVIFAIAAVGCTVQHFVDPDVIWNRNPVRGVLEPLSLAAMSTMAFTAGVCLYRKRYFWAIGAMILIGVIVTAMTSLFGF